MSEGRTTLSLFDGMSCGQLALQTEGIKVKKYYASEIDKHAIKVTQANFPNTIQLGSVVDVDVSKLDRIDLLIGGSPCQSFSFAGKRKGMATKCEIEILSLDQYLQLKSEGFQFEGQSYLFWEYMRILTDLRKINPVVKFLLENVEMGEKWEKILSKAIGVNGIHINSALVSAQNRKRIYWTNIGTQPGGLFGYPVSIIQQPKDKGILLRDILEPEVDEKYFLSEKMIDGILESNPEKSFCIDSSYYKGASVKTYLEKNRRQLIVQDVSTNDVQKDNLVMQLNPSKESNGSQPYQQNRVYDSNGISPALMAQMSCGSHAIKHETKIRRLTPIECERLQTVPDNATKYGFENHYQLFNFTGNKFTICQHYVKKKIVANQFQAEKLNCVTNTIIDLLEAERPNYPEWLLIILRNVSWTDAKGISSLQQKRVLCTIKDGKDLVLSQFQQELLSQTLSVDFVTKKSEQTDQWECVLSISKCLDYMETHYIWKKSGLMLGQGDITEKKTVFAFIDLLLKKKSEENLSKELRLSIILISIKLIITQTIWKSLQERNTLVRINSSMRLLDNSLELELSYIETGNITLISDTARYKMLGNGWTIDVIAHIFSYLK